eukprot:gene6038-6739_t
MATESDGGGILEGFICPICMKDLRTPAQLSGHFEEYHAEDKDILKQLRSAFGKAKSKILKKDEIVSSNEVTKKDSIPTFVSRGVPETGGIDVTLWDAQEFGKSRSHLTDFRRARKDKIERCIVEINNILIRLDKLVKSGIYDSDFSLSSAMKARKDVEKQAVPWESDKSVKFCRYCMKKFNMIIRRHHCRLCGKVHCAECCDFITTKNANDILNPDPECSAAFLKESTSNSEEDKNGIRICFTCLELLQRHCEMQSSQQANTQLTTLHERMKCLISECDFMLPRFLKMATSVNTGDTEYSLDTAMDLRVKLLKTFEVIDALSKKIQFLGTTNENPVHPQVAKLQRLIRMYAANYLQENMFAMPTLPNKQQHQQLVRLKKERDERQRREEKERLIRATLVGSSDASRNTSTLKVPGTSSNPPRQPASSRQIAASKSDDDSATSDDGFFRAGSFRSKFKKKVAKPFSAVSITKSEGQGWGPVHVTMSSSPDPMLQQMDIIKGYIKQARLEKKYEEVALFEMNLKELELEYMRQRQGKP